MRLVEPGAKLAEAVERQRLAEHARKRAQDRPVLARVARREGGAVADLHPAFGVDPGAGFFRVGGAGQDHVGAMRAGIAMRAEIDDERRRPARRSRPRQAGTARRGRHRRPPSAYRRRPCRPRPARSRCRARRRARRRCEGSERPIQSSPIAPTSAASRAAAESTAAPFAPIRAPCPTMISGRFAAFSVL